MDGVILTLLERPETAPGLLVAAGHLATLMGGAGVAALVVRTPPEATILPSEEVLTAEHAARIRSAEQRRAVSLRVAFDRWAARPRAEDAWTTFETAEGVVGEVLRERGRRADALVLERPSEGGGLLARQDVHTALMDTGRPVLVVPPGHEAPFGRRMAIAWRDDPQATRAVLSALRLRAPERILVLAGQREGAPRPVMPDILREHGAVAELHVLPVGQGAFGEALLARAHALGADLLVMGAYQHSPLREFILGGVTRFMLAHADLPLLMRH